MKRKLRFLVVKMTDDKKSAILETTGDMSATFEDFRKAIPTDEARWAAYALEFENKNDDNRKMNKVIFLLFSPDNAKVKADNFAFA